MHLSIKKKLNSLHWFWFNFFLPNLYIISNLAPKKSKTWFYHKQQIDSYGTQKLGYRVRLLNLAIQISPKMYMSWWPTFGPSLTLCRWGKVGQGVGKQVGLWFVGRMVVYRWSKSIALAQIMAFECHRQNWLFVAGWESYVCTCFRLNNFLINFF